MRAIRFVVCIGLVALLQSEGAGESDLVLGPYLQNIKPDAVTIMWETVTPVVGKVIYGEDLLSRSAADIRSATLHEVTLTGLNPGASYKYRCAWGAQLSPPAQFKTAPPEGTRQCRIVLYGDPRGNTEIHRKIATLIAREEPDIVLNGGDLVSRGSDYSLWKTQFFDPITPFASSIPLFTVLGNHEQESPYYYSYFSLPGNESWWSTNYANVHIIGLDSCLPSEKGSEQYRWLAQDLRNNTQEWTIVFFHHPLFNAHPTRSMPPYRWAWQNLFQEYGVDLAVSGHDHYYHRTYPIGRVEREPKRGVVHITTAGGGAGLYPTTERSYSAYRRSCHHFVVLDVGGDRIVGRVINVEGKGIDAFILDKQSVPSPEEFVSIEALKLANDLQNAVRGILPIGAHGKKCAVRQNLESETNFQTPVLVSGNWSGGNSWSITPARFQIRLQPGGKLDIPIRAVAEREKVYPLPTLRLELGVDQSHRAYTDPQIGFRNGTVRLSPLKVCVDKEVKIRRIRHSPVIDGRLDEKDWKRALVVDQFLTDQGTDRLSKRAGIMLMAGKEKLFVGARIEQDPLSLKELPYTGRDNGRLDRVENIGVEVWNGKYLYQFIITAAGDVLDIRGSDRSWNCDVIAMTRVGQEGWIAEAAIPLDEMIREASKKAVWRLNVTRKDGVTGQRGEWIPIFEGMGLDPTHFARLKW